MATFFIRVVMSPFAHPLFTVFTGIGFGIAAAVAAGRRRRRVVVVAVPLLGLVLAMGVHALWNGSTVFGPWGFFLVYGAFMLPAVGLLTWLAVWTRQRELRTLAGELPAYAAAGWLAPTSLSPCRRCGRARMARGYAARFLGPAAARAVGEYEAFATSLAFLRYRSRRGTVDPDFAAREQELLHHLWQRKDVAGPALTYAARATGRAWTPPPHRDYTGYNPYRR